MRLGMMIGYSGKRIELPIEMVQEADRLGYYAVWSAEAYGSDSITPLAWLGALTQQIKLGTAIMQMPARTPAMTAMTAMTLDQLSGGRMLLGLGMSGPQVVEGWHGQPYGKPLGKTREYIKIVREILAREEPVQHEGKFYQIPYAGDDATGLGKPLKSILHGRADMPIYLAAIGPKNVTLSAELADGWLPIFFSPSHYDVSFKARVDAGFAKAGTDKSLDNFDIAPTVSVVVGDDVDMCRNMIKPMLALYVGGMGAKGKNFYNDLVTRYGFGDVAEEIQDLYLAGKKDQAINLVPDDLVDMIALCGPKERIRERLSLWEDSPVTTMNIATYTIEGIRVMAELVNGTTSATTSIPASVSDNLTNDSISDSTSKDSSATGSAEMSNLKSGVVFEEMAKRLPTKDLSDVDAIFQFDISGEEEGHWVVDLKVSPATVEEGQSDSADCTISMSDDDFLALATGELDPTMAFMKGKVKIQGNMGLALKLDKIMR